MLASIAGQTQYEDVKEIHFELTLKFTERTKDAKQMYMLEHNQQFVHHWLYLSVVYLSLSLRVCVARVGKFLKSLKGAVNRQNHFLKFYMKFFGH